MRRLAAALLVLALASVGRADPFPARSGESGLLDVPDAEILPLGGADFAAELRLADGWDPAASVSPQVALVAGLGFHLEAGISVREGGLPGDPRPSPALFGAAVKLGVLAPRGARPGIAADVVVDRVNHDLGGAARLIVSTGRMGPLRLALTGGAALPHLDGHVRPTFGAAASVRAGRLEIVGEAVRWPEGTSLGGGVRWLISPTFGVAIGATVEPQTRRAFASLGLAASYAPPPKPPRAIRRDDEGEAEIAEAPAPAPRGFTTDRPRFRLKIRPPRGAP